jgi:hypothetical protein
VLGSLFAKLSWRLEVLLCSEENIALQGEHFFLYCLPPLPPTPDFIKCKPRPWSWQGKGLTVASCMMVDTILAVRPESSVMRWGFSPRNERPHPGNEKIPGSYSIKGTAACTPVSMQDFIESDCWWKGQSHF